MRACPPIDRLKDLLSRDDLPAQDADVVAHAKARGKGYEKHPTYSTYGIHDAVVSPDGSHPIQMAWKEFDGSGGRAKLYLTFMFVFYGLAIFLVARANA